MSSHPNGNFGLLDPYLELGAIYESAEHLDLLEDTSSKLGFPENPILAMAHASILSEIADIYLSKQAFDPEKAFDVLLQSDKNNDRAAHYDILEGRARRAIVFNGLRKARTANKLGRKILPASSKLALLGLAMPVVNSFKEKGSDATIGAMSELMVMTLTLWRTADRLDAQEDDEELVVAWPSYIRQDYAPSIKVEGNFRGLATNPAFDAWLATYNSSGKEKMTGRTKLQIKTRQKKYDSDYDYAHGRTVIATRGLDGIETPRDMRSLFTAMSHKELRPRNLAQPVLEQLRRTSQSLMEQATTPQKIL